MKFREMLCRGDHLFNTPKHNDLVYDVGLHHGEDSEFYLRKGFRVVAFEADPASIQYSQERLAKFLETGQLTIVAGAIVDSQTWDASQTQVRFYKNDATSVWGTIRHDWATRNTKMGSPSELIEVDAVDFVKALQTHGVPRYMKVDIEGCDMICVAALRQFHQRPTYVSIESDKTSFSKIASEISLLKELGYDGFQAIEQSQIPITQSPPVPPREGEYFSHTFQSGSSGLFGEELADSWVSQSDILWKYRWIRLGYWLVGDSGVLNRLQFPGARRLRTAVSSYISIFTRGAVPGWYDTHARLASDKNRSLD